MALLGATLGGWLGWVLGERLGLMAAFTLSTIGTGFGLYFANRVSRSYLG
jgi:hypothetical protein